MPKKRTKAQSKKKKTESEPQKQFSFEISKENEGLLLFIFSIVLAISLAGFSHGHASNYFLGMMGLTLGWVFMAFFGLSSYLIAFFLGWCGWRIFFKKSINNIFLKSIYVSALIVSGSILLSLIEDQYPNLRNWIGTALLPNLWTTKQRYHLGGAPFFYLYKDLPDLNLYQLLNSLGVAILFGSAFVASAIILFKINIKGLFERILSSLPAKSKTIENVIEVEAETEEDSQRYVKLRIPNTSPNALANEKNIATHAGSQHELLEIKPDLNTTTRPSLSRKEASEKQPSLFELPIEFKKPKKTAREDAEQEIEEFKDVPKIPVPNKKRELAIQAQKVHNGDFTGYAIPSTSLLSNPKKVDPALLKKDLKRQAEVLEETLASFGIEAKVGQINCGPTITSFEVHPAIGVKVQKIKALENDIALNMEAKSIRIIAPIPGKAAVGIEVPNSQPQEVSFKEMLAAYQQNSKKFHIPILLGKAVNGDYVMSDLAKMPHCIIAGATGSGKSVCINTIVMSILLNAKPDEIKLVMVDPKKVELTPYTRLPHMLAPVITEPQGACAALQWLVKEMENRYEILKQLGLRNIEAFNARKIDKEFEASLGKEFPEKMPFIVGIIDELADLMMVANNDIETPIARIAQMARAVGIHLILATQRPSREVITGLIKANFPTRVSFKVASRVNSQIVLDETGAETLLGNGDMLFLPPGSSHLVRAQGAFIRDEDINKVVEEICKQAPPNYVIQSFDSMQYSSEQEEGGEDEGPKDTLFDQAVDTVLGTGNASTTFLQRKLKIGYARAASLMDELERKGVVGPAEGAKPRKILKALRRDPDEIDDLEEAFLEQ